MTMYIEINRFESPDGQAALTIEQGDHGLWRFIRWKLYNPAPDIPELGEAVWVPSKWSGLYESECEAEVGAFAEVYWRPAPSSRQ